jgi:hypothetical protein
MTSTAVHPDTPPTAHEGLASELLARRRKKLPALTAALALAVAVAGGAIGGVEAQKHWGASASATPARAGGLPAGFAARFGARGGGAPGGGAGGFPGLGGGGGATNGTVTLIKGSTLYVTDASGNTVLVHTTAGSTVKKTVSGTLKSVHPGDSVSVTGTQNKDGSYSAQAITIGGGNG